MKKLEELKTIVQKNLAPTFQKLPADLISRSHPIKYVCENTVRGEFNMGRAAVAWVKKVKPFAVLEWKDYHEAPNLIEQAKCLLVEKGLRASCIMCDADFAKDMTGNYPGYTDMPKVGDGSEYMGLKIFRNFSCHYDEGMYIFDNRDALVYLKGKSNHYWNIPPYVVQVTRGVDANPTDSLTWFHKPR